MTPRCSQTTASGRRCRTSACTGSSFRSTHQPKQDPAADLVRDLDRFRSAADVTVFLSRLIGTVSRGEISTRRAAVLSYVAISLMDSSFDGSGFDPLPYTWSIEYGSRQFVNEDDARAFYAQLYADKMRKIAEESLAKAGLASKFPSYRCAPAESSPLPGDSHAHDSRRTLADVIAP
jgi:hypothetical protein